MPVDTLAEPEELSRFREQWKQEVQQRKQALLIGDEHLIKLKPGPSSQQVNGHAPPSDSSTSKGQEPLARVSKPLAELNKEPTVVVPTQSKPRTRSSTNPPVEFGPKLRAAVEVYHNAVTFEQKGDLDEALRLYMKAFRIDPHVDRAFQLLEAQQQARPHSKKHGKGKSHGSISGKDVEVLDSGGTPSFKLPESHVVVTGSLVAIIATWPSGLSFEPEDEREGVAISTLPDELLVHILHYLDTSSLERFGLVNRKSRIVTLDSSLWREFVQATYKPPQISDEEEPEALAETYVGDFRRVFIEHPRVRLDGVYIAICHYIRRGLSESAWVQVNQLITYHRYLRFYPDGTVLSLLANEGREPQQIIASLKPTLCEKGFFIGTWYLSGSTLHISNLTDSTGSTTRYTFQMILELKSKPLGRWNRLDFRAYDSVEVESGECTPVALKHDRPFWFSKVRSFAAEA